MVRFYFYFFAYVSFLILIGCTDDDLERKEKVINPTIYRYHISLFELRKKIILNANSFRKDHLKLYHRDGLVKPLDSLLIFEQRGNKNDFYVMSDAFYKRKSHIYHKKGEMLYYEASFHLHLKSIGEYETEVSVYTIHPQVIIGENAIPSGPHFTRQLKYSKVDPSSIEEYEILKKIGDIIGEKGMPAVKYPK